MADLEKKALSCPLAPRDPPPPEANFHNKPGEHKSLTPQQPIKEAFPVSFPTWRPTVNRNDASPLAPCLLTAPRARNWPVAESRGYECPPLGAAQRGAQSYCICHSSPNIYRRPSECQHCTPRLQLWPDFWLQRQTFAIKKENMGPGRKGLEQTRGQGSSPAACRLWELVGPHFSPASSPNPPTGQGPSPPPLAPPHPLPHKLPSLPGPSLPEAKGHPQPQGTES